MLRDLPLADLLDAFSAPDPTPGGGSAAALSSAIGTSLLMMVAALPKTRTGADQDRTALVDARQELSLIRERLAAAIDGDTAAYNGVVAAYKRPKATAEEQAARKEAIQQALVAATDVPLDVMQLSVRALAAAAIVARHGYKSASSDVGVAIAMLRAGTTGAHLNVGINLESLTDGAFRARTGDQARDLMAQAEMAARQAADLLSESSETT
jgi:formiminotetrahydrofolate cyclodeaminase